MIIPEKLKIGDKIGIISTARKITLEELKASTLILESWGLEIVLGQNLFEENNQFSGTIEQRTADLQSMIDNDAIKAIFCARGGYGTVQIVDNINFPSLKKNPKWIIGYSDVTVLHSHLNNLYNSLSYTFHTWRNNYERHKQTSAINTANVSPSMATSAFVYFRYAELA